MDTKKTITVRELCEYLGIGRKTAYELVNSVDFPSFRIGKKILVNTDALRDWIDRNIQKKGERA